MDFTACQSRKLKAWFTPRPRLDIDESATWFILLFFYAQGLTADEPGFKMSGMLPQLIIPQLNFAMVILCLTISLAILVEPLLPSKIRSRVRTSRYLFLGRYIRKVSVWGAFALALMTGFGFLVEKVPASPWLIYVIYYTGFIIFIFIGIKLLCDIVKDVKYRRIGRSEVQGTPCRECTG